MTVLMVIDNIIRSSEGTTHLLESCDDRLEVVDVRLPPWFMAYTPRAPRRPGFAGPQNHQIGVMEPQKRAIILDMASNLRTERRR